MSIVYFDVRIHVYTRFNSVHTYIHVCMYTLVYTYVMYTSIIIYASVCVPIASCFSSPYRGNSPFLKVLAVHTDSEQMVHTQNMD